MEERIMKDSLSKLPSEVVVKINGLNMKLIGEIIYGHIIARIVFLFVFAKLTDINVSRNLRMENEMKQLAEDNKQLLIDMMDVVSQVEGKIYTGNENIEDLDISAENSIKIYKQISEGNETTAASAQNQARMSEKITELINQVLEKTNGATLVSNRSKTELNSSKLSMQDLKQRSDKVLEYNNAVNEVIQEFVNKVRNVKSITEGINEISEQTNLLSLNASIESARAGESGKGFAIVAAEISKLAEETGALTSNIDSIVKELEDNTIMARELVDKVSNAINKENETIDKTMHEFEIMQNDISMLDIDMKEILDKTNEVADYNNEIKVHVDKMTNITQEAHAYTEEALALTEKNKEKTYDTKVVMEDVLKVVSELVNN